MPHRIALKVAGAITGKVLDVLFGEEEEFEYPHATTPDFLDR